MLSKQPQHDHNIPIDVKRTTTGTRVLVHHVKQEPLYTVPFRNTKMEVNDFYGVKMGNKNVGFDGLAVKNESGECVAKTEMEVCEQSRVKMGNENVGFGGLAVKIEPSEYVKNSEMEVCEESDFKTGNENVGFNGLGVKNESSECGVKSEMEVCQESGVKMGNENVGFGGLGVKNRSSECVVESKIEVCEENDGFNGFGVKKSEMEKRDVVAKEEVAGSEKCGFDTDRLSQRMDEIVQKAVVEKTKPVEDGKKCEESKANDDDVEIMEEGFGDSDEVLKLKKASTGINRYVKKNEDGSSALQKKVKANEGTSNGVKKTVKPKDEEGIYSVRPPTYDMFRTRYKTNKVKEEVDPRLSGVVVDTSDFVEEPGWFLVGGKVVSGVSTVKGKYKLFDNEIVDLNFPTRCYKANSQWIVRFSTQRAGELGRLSIDMGKIIVPLVLSGKVKVCARCVASPLTLGLLQEILLYMSFYIHHSLFSDIERTSWKLDFRYSVDSTIYPLMNLFKTLEMRPFQKAEFTPEEIDSRKRSLDTDVEVIEPLTAAPPLKRIKGCSQLPSENKDEQAISESSLNKLVGAADLYDLEEMEPPSTLICNLKPYQKEALYWMTELEKGVDSEKGGETLHPCWAAYRITDQRASSIYVNIFSGAATTKFPSAIERARGGILADAMGLGKTVMTIALILAIPGRGNPDNVPSRVKGGTLIICPMALLGQWKDELDNHSEPESISVFVHYGGERTNDPRMMACHNVVLTTYGTLAASYKKHGEDSIYHKVDWYRVVLDEAHTIKAWKSQGARATFTLSSHCRWCLTGTPIQNNLEDLYSLLCFLHVEPWCNWEWWNKFIQRPYNNGDPKGLKLVKAILKPLMLRRTKESNDKNGRPILVLPPTHSQIVECKQSEAERDFYDALFRRSKVQFDQFVAQGKVLHNFANILELLLRLRQCCNHPFLVMSRGNSQQYADLNKLARRFLGVNSGSVSEGRTAPTPSYVEEVVEGIRQGENNECPICMEFADDPILTPCAHKMCRECILSSWRTPACGLCPICRQLVQRSDLITCPSENRFHVDIEKNWTESSKVAKLLECLENTRISRSGEKSIVFSQWTCFLDLLEIPLRRKGIGFLRFDGSLSQKQRERVLKEFSETSEKMVLLMSLRAGGVGLNLTAASNVFIMDPWWNPAVEEQAIMRIHRIGQKRTVCIRRFIVKGTVEDRLLQVQAKKQQMIAGALTDDDVRSARIEELKMLFR